MQAFFQCHRHENGSIDFDHYRLIAAQERRRHKTMLLAGAAVALRRYGLLIGDALSGRLRQATSRAPRPLPAGAKG